MAGHGGTGQMTNSILASREAYRLNLAFNSSPVGFAYYDPSDRLRFWNTAYADLNFRIRSLLVEGAYFPDLLTELIVLKQIEIPDDAVKDWIDERLAARRSGTTALRRLTDGRAFLVQERRDEVGGTLGFWLDVTEMVRAGAFRLQPIAENSADLADPGTQNLIRGHLQTVIGALELLRTDSSGGDPALDGALEAAGAITRILDSARPR